MRRSKNSQDGYALLLIVFFVAILVISVAAATPRLLMEGRREKEKEMIWRGNQYVRAVSLFYRKTGHFPAQLEDLYQPNMGIRFMRRAYKDPMNNVDGSWRLIWVAPDGRLMGSLKKRSNVFFFGAPPPPTFAGALSPSSPSNLSASNTLSSVTQNSNGLGSLGQGPNAPGDPNVQSPGSSDAKSAPQSPAASADSNPVQGQRIIIGVGSKIDRASIIRLDGENNYLQFEFVWSALDSGPRPPSPPQSETKKQD